MGDYNNYNYTPRFVRVPPLRYVTPSQPVHFPRVVQVCSWECLARKNSFNCSNLSFIIYSTISNCIILLYGSLKSIVYSELLMSFQAMPSVVGGGGGGGGVSTTGGIITTNNGSNMGSGI